MDTVLSVKAQTTTLSIMQTKETIDNRIFESVLDGFSAGKKAGSGFSFLEISSSIVDLIAEFQRAIDNKPVDFPFSTSFLATFGDSGPLPNFIAAVTSSLKLSATQQIALQDIAVKNKDIVKSPESVQKISMQLQAAGIGYA